MRFARLAQYFERLEGTTKRLEMFQTLSELFQEATAEEIDRVIYLCQEQLLPPFRGVELGMSEKLLTRALAKALDTDERRVAAAYKQRGDLGLVAETLVARPSGRQGLTVTEVYEALLRIAGTAGAGSVEQKIQGFAALLQQVSPIEARYLVRFAMGRLRLGIGDPTILEALSMAVVGHRRLRPELERAYNLCSDLGLVAKTLLTQGEQAIREFRVQVGHPIRMALAERLPSAEEIVRRLGRCCVECKYDGLRLQIHKQGEQVDIFSRNLERLTPMFPDLAAAVQRQVRATSAIVEGEAVAVNEATGELYPFQVTVQRRRKYRVEEMAREFPVALFAFDLLYLDGEDYTPRPYLERRQRLAELLGAGERLRLAEAIITDDAGEIARFFDDCVARGVEGVVAKRLDSPYQAGARNFNWIKLKRSYKGELVDTVDVVLVGYFRGRGQRARFGIGALLGAVYDADSDTFKTVARIGSGLSEEQWVELRQLLDALRVEHRPARVDSLIAPDVWAEPRYVVTVLADEITKSPVHTCGKTDASPGYALRFPRIVGWLRQDKRPEDATTVAEVLKLYELQKRVRVAASGA
jgi:DNA ligase-1